MIAELDRLIIAARHRDDDALADQLDAVPSRMSRWVWPLLGGMDEQA